MTSSNPSRVGVAILALLASTLPAFAQTAGDLAIIGWNDATDAFTLVALSDIPPGTTFYFTDNGWTGTAFRGVTATNNGGSEGVCRLVTNATIPMGTVINNTSTGPAFTWTFSGPITGGGSYSTLALSNADQIYIFTNTATTDPVFSTASMTHIFVLDDTGTFENAAGQFTGNVTPGLTVGSTAITFDQFAETANFMRFNPPPCLTSNGGSKAQWLAAIANAANWTFGTTGTQPTGTINVVGATPAELCDGIDNNCNGQIDEGFPGLAISAPVGFAITCLPSPAPSFVGGSATGCPPPTITSSDGPLVGGPCGGTITRTWTATNAGGSVNSTQTITVNDTTPPTITCPGPVSVQCFSLVPAPNTASASASDNCGGAVTVVHVGDSATNGSSSCNNVITRTYRATDACGNFATCTQTITVHDTTAPSITCPGPVSVQCFSLVPAPNTALVTASDNCGGSVTVIHVGDSASNGVSSCNNVITRTYRATDACGNFATCTQTITVHDTTAPSVTCPGPVSVQCFSLVPAPNTASVTTSDNCGGAVTVLHVGDSASNGVASCNNVVTRTYRATDVCGNFSTCTQIITVNDTTPPTITCPGPVVVQCFAELPSVNPGLVALATASDNCGGAVTITQLGDSSSGPPCNQIITRTYMATDACGNSATCAQIITVHDNHAPWIACPPPVAVACDADVPAPDTNAVDTLDCSSPVTVTHDGDSAAGTCPKIITRTYKATDACGNFATCAQTITVHDTTPPSITCPGPVSVQCFSLLPAPNTGSVTASDNCGGAVTVVHVGDSASNGTASCNNVITRTYRATDACGNFATCTQTITVNDTTPPSVTCAGPVSVQCFSLLPGPDTNSVTASDNCGGAVTVVHVGDSASNGTASCNNVVTRTYQATDACGNFATCTQTITVHDTTPPSVTCPGSVSVQCFSLLPAANTGSVTASDNCGGAVTVVHVGDSASNGASSCNNVVTRTYQATDACGNFATCTQTITVNDTTPPSVTCAGPVSVQCFSLLPGPDTNSVSASDNCGGAVTVVHVGDSASNGTASCNNVITRTYRATDACGNFATCTQSITVNDTVAPTISCPPPFTVPCSSPINPLVTGMATATDDCNPAPVVTYSDSMSGTCPSGATMTRTWMATDGCNVATCRQTITLSAGQGQGCVAGTVTDLGGECGAPAPFLTSSPPVIGEYLAIFITSGAPNSQIILTAQGQPTPPPMPLGGGCVLYNDPLTALVLDVFSTDASGAWQISQLIAANPGLIGVQLNLQAGILFPGGPLGAAQLTNGLTLSFGSCPPFCTNAADAYAGTGYPGQVLDFNYASIFATGLEIGAFDLSGGNAPPNGLRWDATPAGLMALESFLAGTPAPSGPLAADALNPTSAPGAGSLAVQTAALQINIALNDAGVLGSALSGYSALVYSNHPGIPDSLNGQTVTQLLGIANQVLAGGSLPAGYSYDSLATLIENLNLSYHGCVETLFGSRFLFHPVY